MKVGDKLFCIEDLNFFAVYDKNRIAIFEKNKYYKIIGERYFDSIHSVFIECNDDINCDLGLWIALDSIRKNFVTIKQLRKNKLDSLYIKNENIRTI